MELGCRAPSRDEDSTGLAHVAFKIGSSAEELALARKMLHDSQTPVLYEAERGFATSMHVLDPDGNEIELYVDNADAWSRYPYVPVSGTGAPPT